MKGLLVAVILLVSLSGAHAQTQGCTDPPTSPLGKCLKRVGARCDSATRQWVGGNTTAFNACLCINGGVARGYSVEAAKQYCGSGGR
jgi:hypothetical protein